MARRKKNPANPAQAEYYHHRFSLGPAFAPTFNNESCLANRSLSGETKKLSSSIVQVL